VNTFVLLGGTGRIGTAVASHLLCKTNKQQGDSCHIILAGRRASAGKEAVRQVLQEHEENDKSHRDQVSQGTAVSFVQVKDTWDQHDPILQEVLRTADCVIHTAGPYADRTPTALQATIQAGCKVYIDVSDPLAYLETAVLMTDQAAAAGTTALLSAGAFPGMSNVLAVEAASRIPSGNKVQDVRFQYFTAGLGGSGPLNLFITNIGFGEPMVQFHQGALRFYTDLSGLLLGYVDFFIDTDTDTDLPDTAFGNQAARQRVGRQKVFAWPFPEAATVSQQLRIRGNSLAAMGTAPAIWNDMLGLLVKVVPRPWWRNHNFSQLLADFSEPLVKMTDWFLQVSDPTPGGSGKTHAMRVDVTSRDGPRDGPSVTVIQAHDSFRRCVAQSCAEFALDCLAHPDPGVWLPEMRYQDTGPRARIIGQLTTTPGTFCYTGPVQVDAARSHPPTDLEQALQEAEAAEMYPYGQ
jgi:predicted dinucleotide-binding enzyme